MRVITDPAPPADVPTATAADPEQHLILMASPVPPLAQSHLTGPYLVGIADCSQIKRILPAAAAASQAGTTLLIAMLRPRLGFTTDAAVILRASIDAEQERERLLRCIHCALAGNGVAYEVADVSFRDSRSPAKRARRITAALAKAAHRRGAEVLADELLAPDASSEDGSSTPPVVAVLPDSAAAVRIAATGASLSRVTNRPLVLLVPVPVIPSRQPMDQPRRDSIENDTAAITGRVRPTLDRMGVPVVSMPAPYRVANRGRITAAAMAGAIHHAVRQLQAVTVIIDATSPALPALRAANVTVHPVRTAPLWATDAPQRLRRPPSPR